MGLCSNWHCNPNADYRERNGQEIEDKPGNTSKQKTVRKIRTPRKLQAGNRALENKKIPQHAASPENILRGGGSVKKQLKTGSPLLPGRKITRLQHSKLITSNMALSYSFHLYKFLS